jgi:membrane protein YqaA with SNARE-associated domain
VIHEFSALAAPWLFCWCYGLSVVSALVPWLNGEALVLSMSPLVHTGPALGLLVLSASVGQMTGKCGLYWAARRAARRSSSGDGQRLAGWRERLAGRPSRAVTLLFVSSVLGVPPFYLMTILAGGLSVRFRPFFLAGFAGRLVRFSVVVFVPRLAFDVLR